MVSNICELLFVCQKSQEKQMNETNKRLSYHHVSLQENCGIQILQGKYYQSWVFLSFFLLKKTPWNNAEHILPKTFILNDLINQQHEIKRITVFLYVLQLNVFQENGILKFIPGTKNYVDFKGLSVSHFPCHCNSLSVFP